MGKLTKKDIQDIAKLANLKISPQEIEKYTRELSEVVSYVGELSKVDTGKIEPTSQTTGLKNVFRNDLPGSDNCLAKEEALAQGKNVHNDYFQVPDILEERSEK